MQVHRPVDLAKAEPVVTGLAFISNELSNYERPLGIGSKQGFTEKRDGNSLPTYPHTPNTKSSNEVFQVWLWRCDPRGRKRP